jgi:hypothetical protein
MQLTPSAFESARHFIKTQARSLERARFDYYFEQGSAEAVWSALAAFQNADGGFGHGLEADVRSPDSSVICTSIAFQVLRSLHTPATHPLVKTGLDYLLQQYNPQTVNWRTIPPTADQSPHAPWWGNSASDRYDAFSLNPTAEILGYLYDYADAIPPELIASVTAKVMATVQQSDRLEMHDLLCCLRLGQTATLPHSVAEPLMARLKVLVPQTVDTEPASWVTYGLRPLQVIEHPQSPFKAGLEAAVEANLDYEIATQSATGAWEPTWSWADDFPAAWEIAHQEWAGVLTLHTLLSLRQFGRIS